MRLPAQSTLSDVLDEALDWTVAGSSSLDGGTGRFWHDRRRRLEHRLARTRETVAERERFFAECEVLAKVEIEVKGS
jgi:hypothetical protein